jgi:hypothetical protein
MRWLSASSTRFGRQPRVDAYPRTPCQEDVEQVPALGGIEPAAAEEGLAAEDFLVLGKSAAPMTGSTSPRRHARTTSAGAPSPRQALTRTFVSMTTRIPKW